MTKRIKRVKPLNPRARWFELFGVVLVVSVVAFIIAITSSAAIERLDSKTLQVWFLDVGQGDATLIITPEGKKILIDAGPDNTILAKLGAILPPWDRTLDAIVVTHPDADHVTGFVELLDRYEVNEIITSGTDAFTPVVDAFDEALDLEGVEVRLVKAGDMIEFGDVIFETVWPLTVLDGIFPENRNNTSVTFKVIYGETTILLTGDAEEEAERGFASSVGDVDVYKVGHHGSITSTTNNLLEQISPEYAVVSAGFENRHGHPHPIVVDRLKSIDAEIFRTDLQGDILLSSTGDEPTLTPHPLIY